MYNRFYNKVLFNLDNKNLILLIFVMNYSSGFESVGFWLVVVVVFEYLLESKFLVFSLEFLN